MIRTTEWPASWNSRSRSSETREPRWTSATSGRCRASRAAAGRASASARALPPGGRARRSVSEADGPSRRESSLAVEVSEALSAPSAYQMPKARLTSAERGASRERRDAAGSESVRPKPAGENRHRERRAEAKRPAGCERDRAIGTCREEQTPTPALPPMPCTSPIANAPDPGSRPARVRMRTRKSPRRQRTSSDSAEPDDHGADRRLRTRLDTLGQVRATEHDRNPKAKSEVAWPSAPRQAEPGGARPCARRPRRARNSSEVIRVTGMPEAEQQRDPERRPAGRPVRGAGERVIEAEHRQLHPGSARSGHRRRPPRG